MNIIQPISENHESDALLKLAFKIIMSISFQKFRALIKIWHDH